VKKISVFVNNSFISRKTIFSCHFAEAEKAQSTTTTAEKDEDDESGDEMTRNDEFDEEDWNYRCTTSRCRPSFHFIHEQTTGHPANNDFLLVYSFGLRMKNQLRIVYFLVTAQTICTISAPRTVTC
jgi:hypothetical protein